MDDPAARKFLALELPGGTIELGDATSATSTRTSGNIYVAVEQDPAPVLRVTFDGVTTRVDTASGDVEGEQVAAMRNLPSPTGHKCPELKARSRARVDMDCSYAVTTVPYVGGRGWAPGGWTAVLLETRVSTFDIGGSTYAVQRLKDASTLDHGPPGESTVLDRPRDALVTRIVTEGSAHQLHIDRTLVGTLISGPGPNHATLVMSASTDDLL